MTIQCPSCGSANFTTEQEHKSLPVPFGSPAVYDATIYTCAVCGMSGDFAGENDARILAALQKSESASAEAMLRWLGEQGISAAYLERALRLPARTTNRWKGGEVSAAALALLRTIRACPWLLEAADADFDPPALARTILRAAADLVSTAVREGCQSATVSLVRTETTIGITADLHLKPTPALSSSAQLGSRTVQAGASTLAFTQAAPSAPR